MAVKAAISFSSSPVGGGSLYPSCPEPSETSSDGYVNTIQGKDEESTERWYRQPSAVETSLLDPNRETLELFSSE